jgi:hypothetical protein
MSIVTFYEIGTNEIMLVKHEPCEGFGGQMTNSQTFASGNQVVLGGIDEPE